MPPTYKLEDEAYLTIVLHATKYVHAISGILIGTFANDVVTITQALPVAHSDLTVHTTPLTETAFLLAERHAKAEKQSIVGVYFGNAVADDASIGVPPARMADRARAHFAHACLLMLDGRKLGRDARAREHCLRVCVGGAATWGRGAVDMPALVSGRALRAAAAALDAGAGGDAWRVSDFEDHALDPARDWLNVEAGKRVAALLRDA